jgi:hypothetical protein
MTTSNITIRANFLDNAGPGIDHLRGQLGELSKAVEMYASAARSSITRLVNDGVRGEMKQASYYVEEFGRKLAINIAGQITEAASKWAIYRQAQSSALLGTASGLASVLLKTSALSAGLLLIINNTEGAAEAMRQYRVAIILAVAALALIAPEYGIAAAAAMVVANNQELINRYTRHWAEELDRVNNKLNRTAYLMGLTRDRPNTVVGGLVHDVTSAGEQLVGSVLGRTAVTADPAAPTASQVVVNVDISGSVIENDQKLAEAVARAIERSPTLVSRLSTGLGRTR